MSSPESANPNLIESFVRRHLDAYLADPTPSTDLPEDMKRLLCTIIGEVVTLSDQHAEAESVAHDPELTYEFYREATPKLLKSDPAAWNESARVELRMGLSSERFEHELPMHLPHHAEGDYVNDDLFGFASWVARPVTARCFFSLEGFDPLA